MIAPLRQPENRRDRVRAATLAEIRQTARRLLIDRGEQGVSLRAIAREMGMTAPALYRYFANHGDLLTTVADDIFGDLVAALVAARDADPDADVVDRLAAAARAFRQWAVEHPREFAAVFARPLPSLTGDCDTPNSQQLSRLFFELFLELWQARPFPVPADGELAPALLVQLRSWAEETIGLPIPVGALYAFFALWIRLYGLVALEVFGHLQYAVPDVQPLFDTAVAELAGRLRAGERP
ncbi:MAG: TetR/AcrR family transcriptional regulator [Actinobacteria bacterium]|nr:TetR/AcrR family transcriptional regulator [Actinomycetota bacterium]